MSDLSFAHTMRAVVHAMMASVAEEAYALAEDASLIDAVACYPRRQRDFVMRSVNMVDFWHSVTKHYSGLNYVWLPTSGVLPDDEPALGDDCYVELPTAKRRAGRAIDRLMAEFDGQPDPTIKH